LLYGLNALEKVEGHGTLKEPMGAFALAGSAADFD
jgi:hypothetical protein